MNSERGYFTLIGICILLVAAIFVKGIQESELNYAYIAENFKTETELQNAADSALIEAVDLIRNNPDILTPANSHVHSVNQHKLPLSYSTINDIDVAVWYEYGKDSEGGRFIFKERNYSTKTDKTIIEGKSGVILISVASRDSDIMEGKVFARAIGYIFMDGDELILDKESKPKNYVHFMNSVSSDFK